VNTPQELDAVANAAAAARKTAVEIKRKWRHGETPDARAALADHPELARFKSIVVDLAYEEFLLREKGGEPPNPASFAVRFSTYRASVRKMLDAHKLLQERPELLESAGGDWPEIGSTIQDCILLVELGRGAFGRAYLAKDPGIGDRLCVIKVSAGGSDEARLMGRMAHDHVTDVRWAHPFGHRTAVCMPFVGVSTLADVISAAFPGEGQSRTLTAQIILDAAEADDLAGQVARTTDPIVRPNEPFVVGACAVAARIADAVTYLHTKKIIHGDLKPSNVVVGPGGSPHLIDFNLSGQDAPPGTVRGTPAYMAPELLDALTKLPTTPIDPHKADLFALGVVLYELLTGHHPFQPKSGSAANVTTDKLAAAIRGGPPLFPNEIPPSVARVIASCLAVDPGARPASATVVQSVLDRFVSDSRAPSRRRRRVSTAAALVAALLVVLIGAIGPVRPPQTGDEFAARGLARLHAGDPSGAEADFNAAHRLTKEPKDPKYLPFIAYCHSLTGRNGPAAAIGKLAVDNGVRSAEVLNNLGYAWIDMGQFPEAVQVLTDALEVHPNMQAALFNRAFARFNQRLSQKSQRIDTQAIDDILAALAAGPSSYELHLTAANIFALGADDHRRPELANKAIEQLRQAVRTGLKPTVIQNSTLLGERLAKYPGFQEVLAAPFVPSGDPPQLRLVEPSP
jgi:hypothetical protein